jgi:hypothetical protein
MLRIASARSASVRNIPFLEVSRLSGKFDFTQASLHRSISSSPYTPEARDISLSLSLLAGWLPFIAWRGRPFAEIYGAAPVSNDPMVIELLPDQTPPVLLRGSIISADVSGKGVLGTTANANNVIGVLLDGAIDTSVKDAQGKVSATIERKGSFKASQLHIAEGSDLSKFAAPMRQQGMFLEGLAEATE